MRRSTPGRIAAGLVAAGAGLGLYATVVERQWFALRRVTVPVLPAGAQPLSVLHLSDLHMLPRQRRKQRWVSALARLRPDVVILTGDIISAADAIEPSLQALGDLLDAPGGFVFGNNDFYAPEPKSPHRYFTRRTQVRREVDLPWPELRDALTGRGWRDLNNSRGEITVGTRTLALAGVGDPHTRRDHYEQIAGAPDPRAAARIGVTHSPEPHVLDAFARDGYQVVLAGHTHGGQVRLPGIGALVTNCGVDRSRARGLSRWGARMWLHVSAGLGNSPYMPVRFCCRPEATLITLAAGPRA